MSNKTVTMLSMVVVALFTLTAGSFAQGHFVRAGEIPVPETDLNNGGTGNMVSGVDLDQDGKTEIYLVNDNWNDGPTEVIPRIYKLEKNGDNWDLVWQAVAPIEKQNTWPTLNIGDLDKDGKPELIWGVVNNLSGATVLNPYRILVYELRGDGTDVMGVSDGSGGYLPNAKWTISSADNDNIRPIQARLADPDNDGVTEILLADRAGRTGGVFCGIISVSNIPDNGDGSETWTMEASGLDFNLKAGTTQNKWDVVALGANVYSFCEIEVTKLTWDGFSWGYTRLAPIAGGAPVQSTQVVDLDKDGTMEIVAAVYDWGNDAHKSIYLLQEEGDTLKHTELVNVSKYWPSGSRGPWGGASGDIDGDGKLDFVYGSRASTPNAGIFHLAYKGGAITDPANYTFAIIDSLYSEGGIWTNVNLANIDSDPQLEVLYTSSTDAGVFPDLGTKPIVVLDYVGATTTFDRLVVAEEVKVNGAPPSTSFLFKPGRILDNGQTIWFVGANSSPKETYVFRSIDGGRTFTHNATPLPERAAQMTAFDTNTAITVQADGKIHRTTDGGATWSEVYSYTISPIAPGWFDGLCLVNETTAVVFGDMEPNGNMHFVRTEDKGATWTEILTINYLQAAYAYYTYGLVGVSLGDNLWAAATNMEYVGSYIFRSRDGGINWESFEIPTSIVPNYPRAIAFSGPETGMIAARGGYVVKTTDGGANWEPTNKPDASADCYVNGVVHIPGTDVILGLDDIGVFYTRDLGATWNPIEIALDVPDDDWVGGLFLNSNFGYVFSYNGQVLRFENMLTGVNDRPADAMPENFTLSQNYPNPFNPTTTISFTLPATQNISLVIYNLKGEVVKSLVDGEMNEGLHSVKWDATDAAGQKVTSGIYIYTLRSNNQQLARRMILVK